MVNFKRRFLQLALEPGGAQAAANFAADDDSDGTGVRPGETEEVAGDEAAGGGVR